MLVIEPTKGRWLTDWSEINWTAVERNVKRVQGRTFRAEGFTSLGFEPFSVHPHLSSALLRFRIS